MMANTWGPLVAPARHSLSFIINAKFWTVFKRLRIMRIRAVSYRARLTQYSLLFAVIHPIAQRTLALHLAIGPLTALESMRDTVPCTIAPSRAPIYIVM